VTCQVGPAAALMASKTTSTWASTDSATSTTQLDRHEVLPSFHPGADCGQIAAKVNETHPGAGQGVAIALFQGRTRQDSGRAAFNRRIDDLSQRCQPRPPIHVGKRDPLAHLLDI
jgi:hypothetical protein